MPRWPGPGPGVGLTQHESGARQWNDGAIWTEKGALSMEVVRALLSDALPFCPRLLTAPTDRSAYRHLPPIGLEGTAVNGEGFGIEPFRPPKKVIQVCHFGAVALDTL